MSNPTAIELPRRKTSFSGSHTGFRGWLSTREGCSTLFRAFYVLLGLGNLGSNSFSGPGLSHDASTSKNVIFRFPATGTVPRGWFSTRDGAALCFEHFLCSQHSGTSGPLVLPDCLTKIRQQSSCRCFDVEKRHFRFPGPHRVPRLVIDEGRVLHFISSIFCAPGTREPRVPGFSGLSDENPAAIELQVLPRRKTSFSGSHTEFRGWFSTREGCCTLFRAFSVLPALGNLGTTRHPGTVPGPAAR